jgi:RNA polymerase sigma factor (TIGR02999 family)
MTGTPHIRGELDPSAYAELRSIAARELGRERRDHTLRPTDLVHEAWLRLEGARSEAAPPLRLWAARTMRQVLVDHARRRSALRRDAGRRAELEPDDAPARERDEQLFDLDAALLELARLAPELAAIVELLHFGGCTVEEAARELQTSPRTVKRRWRLAKAWLHREIADDHDA